MQEETLAFQLRVQPDRQRLVASSMGNLAASYSRCGRYESAAQLQEEKLATQRLVLAEDHLELAASMNNLVGERATARATLNAYEHFHLKHAAVRRMIPQRARGWGGWGGWVVVCWVWRWVWGWGVLCVRFTELQCWRLSTMLTISI